MALILKVKGHLPQIGQEVFLAPNASVMGEVKIGNKSSVWFNVVIRGDVNPIEIGDETNIQDNTVIHATTNYSSTKIGNRVTVGHSAILHGCEVEDLCLIGMGAIVMDKAKISARSIVGAGALVTDGQVFEPESLIIGRPAKAVRKLTAEEIAFLSKSANNYLEYKEWYKDIDL